MSTIDTSRRDFLRIAAVSAVAASAVAVTADKALAYQGNMERAISSLYDALASLREATPNKGGHKATAIQLIEQAISEVQAGVDFADEHGGGGNGE
jgi:phage-related minor tail protein